MKLTDQKIIAATIDWIQNYGYDNFSLRKLANQLNVTAAAIYKHFKNKDELFEVATKQLSADFINHLQLETAQNSTDKLLLIAQYFCQQFEEQTNLMDFLFFNSQALMALNPQKADQYPFLKKVKQLIHDSNQTKINDQDLFIKLWSFIQGYALLIKNQVTAYNSELVSSSLKELLGAEK